MRRVTTEAIALRRTPFGETSQVAEFLTRDHGRMALILKGVHRPRDRKGGGVDLLDHCVVVWSRRRGSRSLPPLVERRILSHHPRMRSREDLLLAGEYLVELLAAMAPEGQPVRRLFDLAVAFLGALERRPPPAALPGLVFALQGGMLRLTGFEPVLDRCTSCERRPEGFHSLRCDPRQGGIVCSACRSRNGEDHSFPLSMAAARLIRSLAGADPGALCDVTIPDDIERQTRLYYDRIMAHVLERAPRCHVLAGVAR